MKKVIIFFTLFYSLLSLNSCNNRVNSQSKIEANVSKASFNDSINRLNTKKIEYIKLAKENIKRNSKEAKLYCINHKLNEDYCFLIDMSIHSGLNRFFVYDFKKDSVINSNLVAHGCGLNNWGSDETKENPTFSNTPDSHLSSLGKYIIEKRGYSSWGINVNYTLNGLEKSNNNAKKRIIVMHGWKMITNHEIYPKGTVEGWGCPAVSNNYMTYLDSLIKKQNKSVLMWIYE